MLAGTKMDDVAQLRKRYCSSAMVAAIIVGFVLIGLEMRPIGKGIILGALFSILNFILMSMALPRELDGSAKSGALRSLGSVLFRYVFMAAALYVGIQYEAYNVFAVAGGLFSVQLMILGDHLVLKRGV